MMSAGQIQIPLLPIPSYLVLLMVLFLLVYSSPSTLALPQQQPHSWSPVDRTHQFGLNSSSSSSNSNEHFHPLPHPDDPHPHPHDGTHRGSHKLHKLNIQQYITQREIERYHRNEPTWKTHFPEILAGVILTSGMVIFLCWWNWTKRGRQIDRGSHHAHFAGTGARENKRRNIHRHRDSNTPQRDRAYSMPELYINANPVVPLAQYPKSVCSPEHSKRNRVMGGGATNNVNYADNTRRKTMCQIEFDHRNTGGIFGNGNAPAEV